MTGLQYLICVIHEKKEFLTLVQEIYTFVILSLIMFFLLFCSLNIQHVEDMKELYHHKPERLVRRDLMRLTWTTKHRWFPNNEHRYEDCRKRPRERPFL